MAINDVEGKVIHISVSFRHRFGKRDDTHPPERGKRIKTQKSENHNERLKVIGRERLQKIVPADVKAVILAELHQDESNSMTDYFAYSTKRTVILGFSNHTKDLFSEMRKYAANFEETSYLTEKNEKYEHREKYTGGDGYYLGKSKYSGWIVTKEKFHRTRESIIESYALIAGDENNIKVSRTI